MNKMKGLLIAAMIGASKSLDNKIIRIFMRDNSREKIKRINYHTKNNYQGRLINNKSQYNLRRRIIRGR